MKLGDYEFEWVPDEMDIPRPQKTVAVQSNLGNVGFFSWPPLTIGQDVRMKWKFASLAQYEAFKAMYLAGGTHVLDLGSSVIVYDDGISAPVDPSLLTYPDPRNPGEVGGPTYRRFYVGLIFNAAGSGDAKWPDINSPSHNLVYYNYQAFEEPQGMPAVMYAIPKVKSLTNPLSAYLEFDKDPTEAGLPDYRPGTIIYDEQGYTWTVVLPWQDELRPFWLYPDPLLTTTKVYYRASSDLYPPVLYPEVSGSGPYFVEVRAHPNCSRLMNSYYSDSGYSLVTDCGEDDQGTWIKLRPYPGYSQIRLCAGEQPSLYAVGAGYDSIDILPWGNP